VPGDKSISHRALMLGSIAQGRTNVSGFLAGGDCLATLTAMRQLGVSIQQPSDTQMSIEGVGLHGLRAASTALDLANSGTAMRLMAGLLCGQDFSSVLTGDESLTQRPMSRIVTPLTQMGANIDSADGMAPLRLQGSRALQGIDYTMPVASAQVKSAVLLAGLYAAGTTTVSEPSVTRNHTECMLRAMGVDVKTSENTVILNAGQTLVARDIQVPADLSSAAFLMLAAILAQDADILIRDVGVNPTRTGVIDILQAMGADIVLENKRFFGTEPAADLRVRSSQLHGIEVDPTMVSLAIDEFPVLFVAAAVAAGSTHFSGLAELRVKESDRIATMAQGIRTLGINVDDSADGAVIHGGKFGGGTVKSHGDHRVAMSLAVAGTIAEDIVTVADVASVATSFPGFSDCMASIGADIRCLDAQL
jgi:3-phosphoshikimate 1-carboxyvinyltransferase